MEIHEFQADALHVEVYPDSEAASRAAAAAAAKAMRELSEKQDVLQVMFATGASQLQVLRALVAEPDVPWNKVSGFHLDEYIGLDAGHPASFRRYLRDNLRAHTTMRSFLEIDGSAREPEEVCRRYAEALREAKPQLCLLGIGENGHLAFNDPDEADFEDAQAVKVVSLDRTCREQQVAEGWFGGLEETPKRAITVTLPTIMRAPQLIVTVPGRRKAQIVRRTLEEGISVQCPATILRTHPNATLYLDLDSAAELRPGAGSRPRA